MTTATRDRKRQTETKIKQQNILEPTGIARNCKNTIYVCSNINQFCTTNHVETNTRQRSSTKDYKTFR